MAAVTAMAPSAEGWTAASATTVTKASLWDSVVRMTTTLRLI